MSEVKLPPHLSFSQLKSYLDCGERYRLEKIEKVPSRPGWALPGGSAVHAMSEQVDLAMLGYETRNLSWEAMFEECISDQERRSGFERTEFRPSGRASKEWPNKEDASWWNVHGPIFVKAWEQWRQMIPWDIYVTPEGMPGIELELRPTFGGIPVVMFIDRVMVNAEGELIVVDLKTGSREPEADQAGLYAAGVEQMLGVRPSYGAYWMARKGNVGQVHDLSLYTADRLGYEYSAGRRAMEAGVFLPHKSPLCVACGVADACYAVKGSNAYMHLPFTITSK